MTSVPNNLDIGCKCVGCDIFRCMKSQASFLGELRKNARVSAKIASRELEAETAAIRSEDTACGMPRSALQIG